MGHKLSWAQLSPGRVVGRITGVWDQAGW